MRSQRSARDVWLPGLTWLVAGVLGGGCRSAKPQEPLDAAGDDAGPRCDLTPSPPVTVAQDRQVVENLWITSTAGPAVVVQGHQGVVIRNCVIHHAGGPGIDFAAADNLRIEDVSIINDDAPERGANPSESLINIHGYQSTGVIIQRAKLERGSSGIYLLESPGAHLSFLEGHDFRGPFPRGQLVQLDKSPDAIVEDFSAENPPDTSFPEDVISVYQSARATVRRGLIDGNNSTAGVGVMFELSGGEEVGLCEDVDAIHQGNGAFSAYPGIDVTFRTTRMRDNICSDQGRGLPLCCRGRVIRRALTACGSRTRRTSTIARASWSGTRPRSRSSTFAPRTSSAELRCACRSVSARDRPVLRR